MPTTFLVDDATNTPFTSGSAGVQVVVGTATSINGSPVGALAGLVGNFALDTSTNTLWACTASGTSGSAQWEQVLTDPSLYALINGSSGQVFNVADATQDSEAVSYGQAFQLLSGTPPSSITLGNTLHTVAQYSLTASGAVTLEPGSVVGQEITIFGGAYALTVNSNVTSGSPYFELPDGSTIYSWTIPASEDSQGIKFVWDGTNWRARTFGQMVVAPATQNNEAVQLGQLQNGTESLDITGLTATSAQINGNATVTGLFTANYDIKGQTLTYNNTGLTVGWNFSNGQGEVDLLLGPQDGDGGLNIYQLNSSGDMVSTTPILALSNTGQLTIQGEAFVAPATQNNAAVSLGQVLASPPNQSHTSVTPPAANTTYNASLSFTAPCAGYVIAFGCLSIAGTLATGALISYGAQINGATGANDENPWPVNTEFATASVSNGEAVTVNCYATTNATAPGADIELHIAYIFIPNP